MTDSFVWDASQPCRQTGCRALVTLFPGGEAVKKSSGLTPKREGRKEPSASSLRRDGRLDHAARDRGHLVVQPDERADVRRAL